MNSFAQRRLAAVAVAIAWSILASHGAAWAQAAKLPCEDFIRNPGGSWTPMRDVQVEGFGRKLVLRQGGELRPGAAILGVDFAGILDQQCPSVAVTDPNAEPPPAAAGPAGSPAAVESRVEPSRYADANGNIDMQKLTCGQLADTSQANADFLGAMYIGWYNGLAKRNAINVTQIKDVIRNLVLHCRANRDKRVTQAIDFIRRADQR